MNKLIILSFFFLLLIIGINTKKISKSKNSGSGRSSSRKYNSPQPVPPTSFTYPQPSAPKPSLFGWQEKPAQRTQNSPRQSIPSSGQSHSYPSSQTGLSGGNAQPKQPPAYQESIQRSNTPLNSPSQSGHGYPTSNGLSGNSGSGTGYPQKNDGHTYPNGAPPYHGSPRSESSSNGLSGTGVGYSQQTGSHTYPGAEPPSYIRPESPNRMNNGGNYPTNNYGPNSYQHLQGQPTYINTGSQYNGFSGHGPYNPGYGPQMPGYFGNVANYGRGFGGGGLSRTGSALTGVGIAGAGIGTILTGLALWNLARSTGHNHHTVIYDNRGQPVAVAPDNSTAPASDSMLAELVNCSLTISSENATEVLAIPCSIATSFTPDTEVKELGGNTKTNDNTKCTVTVVTKTAKEYMTTIPCSILLNTAAENNVTEPPFAYNETLAINGTNNASAELLTSNSHLMLADSDQVASNNSLKCIPEPGEVRDPINPCFAVTHNLTVIPINSNEKSFSTPGTA